jgi:type IVB pilus formation R64 PilN family outer membrane protein
MPTRTLPRAFSAALWSPRRALPALSWLIAGVLSGCASPTASERVQADQAARSAAVAQVVQAAPLAEQARGDVPGGAADTQRRVAEQLDGAVLRRSAKPWVAGKSVSYADNDLPSVFADPVKLNWADRPSLRTMAERLMALTGVPIRIQPEALMEAASGGVRTASAAPAAAAPGLSLMPGGGATTGLQGPAVNPAPVSFALREAGVHAVPMQWSGSLAGYLDHVMDMTGLSWEFRDNSIVIERLRTETFSVDAFEGEITNSMSMNGSDSSTGGSGSTSGSSSSGATSEVTDKGNANAVASLIRTIKHLIKDVPGADVVRAEGSGRLIVTASREAMSRVREFMRTENEALRRRVQIQFDIYSVRRNEHDERGVDWEAVLNSVSHAFNLAVTAPATLTSSSAAGVTYSVLDSAAAPGSGTARRFGGSKAMLALLNEYGTAAEHRPVSMIAMNRQWVRKGNVNSTAYVSETTPGVATSVGAGAPGLKTATLTTGDRYTAMPQVMDSGAVLLKFGLGLSSLVELANFTSGSGSSQQTVQTPETTSYIDQTVVLLNPGQVLAITGLSRLVSTQRRRALTEEASIGLGGSRNLERVREDFVIFVRTTLMP